MSLMRSSLFVIVSAWMVLLCVPPAAGQPLNGGAGLPHTRPAWVLERGHLTAEMGARFWGTAVEQSYAPYGAPGKRNIWDMQNALALNWGLGARLEAQAAPVIYQSDQSGSGIYGQQLAVGLMLGSLRWPARSWHLGAGLTGLLPTGSGRNFLFSEYDADAHALILSGLVSYAFDPDFPAAAPSLHFNAGYTMHDDLGKLLTGEALNPDAHVLRRSRNLRWSGGVLFPGERFDLGVEAYGLAWLQRPPAAAEGREDYGYASLSLRYKPANWLHFALAADRRLTADHDATRPTLEERGLGETGNYPGWRLHLRMGAQLLPLTVLKTGNREHFIRRADERAPVFEKIIDDGSGSPGRQEELNQLREERKRTEKEMERLRRIIEGKQVTEKKEVPPPPKKEEPE